MQERVRVAAVIFSFRSSIPLLFVTTGIQSCWRKPSSRAPATAHLLPGGRLAMFRADARMCQTQPALLASRPGEVGDGAPAGHGCRGASPGAVPACLVFRSGVTHARYQCPSAGRGPSGRGLSLRGNGELAAASFAYRATQISCWPKVRPVLHCDF